MAVHAATPRAWREGEVELVQRVASRCWESIERARVTRSLSESEHQFRELANSIANLAWMARPDGYDLLVQRPVVRLHRHRRPRRWKAGAGSACTTRRCLPDVKELWQQSLATGTAVRDGVPAAIADRRVPPLPDPRQPGARFTRQVVHWFGTNTDVENERRATEANALLRQREQMARAGSGAAEAAAALALHAGADADRRAARPGSRHRARQPADLPASGADARRSSSTARCFDVLPDLGTSRVRDDARRGLPHGCLARRRGDAGHDSSGPTGATENGYFNFVYSPFRTHRRRDRRHLRHRLGRDRAGRGAAAGERAARSRGGGEPREGRVPRHARPRAAQPAVADPHRAAADAAPRRRRRPSASAPSSSARSTT